jgi:hypothetical protein
VGLEPADAASLLARLADSAAAHAQQEAVCVFDLVDDTQARGGV